MRWQLTPYRLRLRHPWQSSQSHITHRHGWLIRLSEAESEGLGDCAPMVEVGTERAQEALSWLNRELPLLEGLSVDEALQQLPKNSKHPAARCGLEMALLNLAAQQRGVPLSSLLGANATDSILVNGALGRLDQQLPNRLTEALKEGFTTLKLKVGLASVEAELKQLTHLDTLLPEGVVLRLDANRAWSFAEAERFIHGLRDLPIEALEEPLQRLKYEMLQRLQSATTCQLALDESLPHFNLEELLQRKPVQRLILKPMVHGGLLATRDIARQAHSAGLHSIITSVIESAVGLWANCHLAAVLDSELSVQVHGLSTSSWLSEDVAAPPTTQQGQIGLLMGCAFKSSSER